MTCCRLRQTSRVALPATSAPPSGRSAAIARAPRGFAALSPTCLPCASHAPRRRPRAPSARRPPCPCWRARAGGRGRPSLRTCGRSAVRDAAGLGRPAPKPEGPRLHTSRAHTHSGLKGDRRRARFVPGPNRPRRRRSAQAQAECMHGRRRSLAARAVPGADAPRLRLRVGRCRAPAARPSRAGDAPPAAAARLLRESRASVQGGVGAVGLDRPSWRVRPAACAPAHGAASGPGRYREATARKRKPLPSGSGSRFRAEAETASERKRKPLPSGSGSRYRKPCRLRGLGAARLGGAPAPTRLSGGVQGRQSSRCPEFPSQPGPEQKVFPAPLSRSLRREEQGGRRPPCSLPQLERPSRRPPCCGNEWGPAARRPWPRTCHEPCVWAGSFRSQPGMAARADDSDR